MAKLISLLFFIVVLCHSTRASGHWSVGYGERTATPVQTFADSSHSSSDGQVSAASLPVEQYFENIELHQSQPQTGANGELLNQAVQNPNAEHKVGTKGGFLGLFSRQKQPQTVTSQLLLDEGQTQQFLNSGYIDTAPVAQLANTTGSKEQRSRFRSYLPWNWVFVSPTTHPVEETPLQQTVTVAAPKRSWSIFPQRPSYPKRQFSQCYCWGQPGLTYPSSLSDTYPVQGSYHQNPFLGAAPIPNVQLVHSSGDYQGLESIQRPTYVPAPSNAKVTNPQPSPPSISLEQQQPVQTIAQQPESTLGSTGAVEQSSTQQVASQQGSFNYPSNTFASNANSASIPTTTNNFQSSAGAQSNQVLTAN